MTQNEHHRTQMRLRDALRGLPDPELPQTLWPAMQSRLQSRRRNRRLGIGGILAVAFVASGAALWMPVDPNGGQIPDSIARPASAPDADADIRAIDTALQTAYAEGLSDADISPLWRERERLMSLRNARKADQISKGGQA